MKKVYLVRFSSVPRDSIVAAFDSRQEAIDFMAAYNFTSPTQWSENRFTHSAEGSCFADVIEQSVGRPREANVEFWQSLKEER